jgi:hypothetical protein
VSTTVPKSSAPSRLRLQHKTKLRVAYAGVAIVLLVAVIVPLAIKNWPFRNQKVKPMLETVFASKINIDRYHTTYFPHPGLVAEGLTMRRNTAQDLPPIGSADTLIVQGNWLDLLMLRHRIRLVDVKGLHVVIPPVGSRANHEDFPPGSSADFAGPKTAVDTFHLQEATLDIIRDAGGRYSFPIHDLSIHNLQSGQAVSYEVDMQNAKPTGRIQAHGSFGPVTPHNLGDTPLSGDFVFSPVNLGDIGKLRGTMSAQGHFTGRLADIEANATSHTPDFAVNRGTPTDVSATAQATINGLNADVVLHTIEARTGKTVVHAGGAIMGSPKVTNLDIVVTKGRAEDLLRPFLHELPPVAGFVWMKSHARVVPGGHGVKFLDRLQMDGGFEVPAERITNHAVEKKLSAFSARAQGAVSGESEAGNPQDAVADAVSSLAGKATIRHGVLSTERLTFVVPGAVANLKGTYNFRGGAVHLTGDLRMDADISHATTGFKSAMLKPLAPFFKKKKAGAVVPIAVTGVPHQYKVGQNLLHTK